MIAVPYDRPASAQVIGKDLMIWSSGRLGAVSVIGDSVLLGSGLWAPTLPDELAAAGWGPIRYRAGVGYTAGRSAGSTTGAWWLDLWRSQGWDAPNVIVNLGANDSGICGTNLACARGRILDTVAAIGPGHRIWWPMVTRAGSFAAAASTWNTALGQIAAERNDFFTWNWPHEMATGGYTSSDDIHLTVAGYQKRSRRMAEEFTKALAVATRVGPDAAIPAATSAATRFVPLTPTRVFDTRHGWPGRRPDGGEVPVSFGNLVPAGTTAVAINVTSAYAGADGYLSAGPCGGPHDASTVNYTRGAARGAMTVVPLDASGRVCIFNRGETDIVVDLQGAFVGGSDGSGFTPLATNERLVDTRHTGRASRLVIPTPPGASAVAVNLTVVNAVDWGFLSAAPCGATTDVSNVNFGPGEPVAGSAFVATSPSNTICVDVSTSADVIVDLTGTFGDGGLSFVPVPPTRMLDTRNAIGGWAPIHGAEQTLDIAVAPAAAEAVTGTITIVDPVTWGFLIGHRCGQRPPTSSVNADADKILANSMTTGITGGRLCIYSYPLTHTLFDVTGWWVR